MQTLSAFVIRKRLWCALFLCALLSIFTPPLSLQAAEARAPFSVQAIFRPLLPALESARIPVFLPTRFPGAKTTTLYSSVEVISYAHYALNIDRTPQCYGASACHYAYIEGYDPTLIHKPRVGQRVGLHNRVTAYYQAFTCGASCGDSTLTWLSEGSGIQYTVGIKAGTLSALTDFANSALDAGHVQFSTLKSGS